MPEAYIALTPVHWFYLVGVLVILFTMILRKDTPLVCIAFLFGIGLVGKCSLAGGIQTIFSSIIYAIGEFREVITTIALVTAFSKCIQAVSYTHLDVYKRQRQVMCFFWKKVLLKGRRADKILPARVL